MKVLIPFLLLLPLCLYGQTRINETFKFSSPINKSLLSDAVIKGKPDSNSDSELFLPKGTSLQLIGIYKGFYRVRYKDLFGFVHFVFIDGSYEKFTAQTYTPVGSRIEYDYENEPNDVVYYAKIEYATPLRTKPSESADTLSILPDEAVFKVVQFNKDYWRVENKGQIGYLAKRLVLRVAKTLELAQHPRRGDYQPKTTKELFAETDAISEEAKRTLRQATKVKATRTSTSYYIRGPRGGCYYITASGRKEYVDRSLCN